MNKCYLQRWEESERGWGVRPDGCSLHLTPTDGESYIDSIYESRGDDVPDEYERVCGSYMKCFVSDVVFESLKRVGSKRVYESELRNLLKLEEIIIKSD